jgi:cbb3-type cytochrome oxidase maturation protein
MSVIVLLIAVGGAVAVGFLCAFAWAVRSGQFDDTCTPAIRVLLDEAGGPQSPHSVEGAPDVNRPR